VKKNQKNKRKLTRIVRSVKKSDESYNYRKRWEKLVVQTRLRGIKPRGGIMNME